MRVPVRRGLSVPPLLTRLMATGVVTARASTSCGWARLPPRGGGEHASYVHYGIRACSGHSYELIDAERLRVPLT